MRIGSALLPPDVIAAHMIWNTRQIPADRNRPYRRVASNRSSTEIVTISQHMTSTIRTVHQTVGTVREA